MSKKQIEDAVKHSLESYFKDLRGSEPDNLHDMLIKIVEKPLLEVVLKHADNNESKASQWIWLYRNTLRKYLNDHNMR